MKRLFVFTSTLFLSLCVAGAVAAQDVNERSDARQRLFDAIQNGDKETVLKILRRRHHVNLNHRDTWDGETFLIEAIRADQPEIVEILLRRGADPNLREIAGLDENDKQLPGDTPLAAALELDSTAMVELLLKHGVMLRHYPDALHASTSTGMLRFLLDHGASINGRDENGATYLQVAASDAGNDAEVEEVARLLIERGANVNISDNDGATPLMRCESVEIAQLLIERGANVNATDKEGLTPLHMAAFEESRIELGRLLIDKGADVNARNKDGYTPLDFLVADAFDYDFAFLLVAHGARVNEELVREHGLQQEFEMIRKGIVNPDAPLEPTSRR